MQRLQQLTAERDALRAEVERRGFEVDEWVAEVKHLRAALRKARLALDEAIYAVEFGHEPERTDPMGVLPLLKRTHTAIDAALAGPGE